jgi:hypothetical protein
MNRRRADISAALDEAVDSLVRKGEIADDGGFLRAP